MFCSGIKTAFFVPNRTVLLGWTIGVFKSRALFSSHRPLECSYIAIDPSPRLFRIHQVAFFILSAVVHAIAHARWRRRVAKNIHGHWPYFGWFTSMSCLGCVAGALAYGARIGQLYFLYTSRRIEVLPNLTAVEAQGMNQLRAQELRYCAMHFMIFPFELLFVVMPHRIPALKL